MPIHDWSRAEAGVFHDFHHAWIEEIKRALNAGILPADYYAMAEQHAAGFGPDVLTLQGGGDDRARSEPRGTSGGGGLLLATPRTRLKAETDLEFYRRRQKAVTIRHASGDRIVAMIEVVSPGNKSSRHALRSFIDKATWLIDRGIHLLVLDLQPPGPRDPQGIHGAIWDELTGRECTTPPDKPLTLVAYESEPAVRAYVEPVAVGDTLTDMPLFLEPGGHVLVPLEDTYRGAFAALARRWRTILEA
jgi:hypothetical protein